MLLADNPIASVATTLIATVPTLAFTGVPLKLRVAALKLSQAGSASPLASWAERVNTSPASWSENVLAGTVNVHAASSLILAALSAFATVGAWLIGGATASAKPLLTLAPAMSVAVTCRLTAPTLVLGGVPLNAPVVGLKLSQLGSGLPLANWADRVSTSPMSSSAKVAVAPVVGTL